MWLDSYEMSNWAYHYCRNKKDRPEVRKLITNSRWVYYYCNVIKDDPEVRKYVDKGLENVLSILRGK